MLIVRRSQLYYTVSGIITPIGVMIPEVILRLLVLSASTKEPEVAAVGVVIINK